MDDHLLLDAVADFGDHASTQMDVPRLNTLSDIIIKGTAGTSAGSSTTPSMAVADIMASCDGLKKRWAGNKLTTEGEWLKCQLRKRFLCEPLLDGVGFGHLTMGIADWRIFLLPSYHRSHVICASILIDRSTDRLINRSAFFD
jgi:hypothetical protein